ncbi:SLAM family member 5-like, partial [Rhinoderma darwinii]|uniref:SLAM family member 5-like n=1 Tax=Rhinoderma darwinii TaxID=43563 RepID=UPI003F675DA0
FLDLQGENFCGKLLVVNGAHDDNVTLRVYNKNLTDVTWLYNFNRIASTGPQTRIRVTGTYKEKLASGEDGSLIIMNLRQEDEGTYDASIKLRTEEMCTVHYQLHMYPKLSADDIKMEYTVSSHEPCHVILTCTTSGSNVTITWTGGDINVTRNIVNVTDPETRYTCTAQNPVSHSSKSITPRKYCEEGSHSSIVYASMVVIIAAIIIISVAGYQLHRWYQKRTRPVESLWSQ